MSANKQQVQQQADHNQEETWGSLRNNPSTWTSSNVDSEMGLMLGMKQNETLLCVNRILSGVDKTLN